MKQETEDAETLWVVDPARLKSGDVLLEGSSDPWSRMIRLATRGRYSHALLWLGETDFIEAMPGGLRMMPYPRVITPDPDAWMLLRLPDELKALEAANRARNHVFKKYDTLGAGLSLLKGLEHYDATAAFCSQLVGLAFEEAGVSLVPGLSAGKITPADLEKSLVLTKVRSPFVQISDPNQRREAIAALDRTAAYAETELQKEVLISQRAFKSVQKTAAKIKEVSHRPENRAQLIELLAVDTSTEGDICSDQLLSSLRSQGYFNLWRSVFVNTTLNLNLGLQEIENAVTDTARRDFLIEQISAEARAWFSAKARAMHNYGQCSQAYSLNHRALFNELRTMYWMHGEGLNHLDHLVRQSPPVAAVLSKTA